MKTLILSLLLTFLPISIAAEWLHWDASIIFLTAAIAIIPLAAWMGTATEELAVVVGPTLGGLLNATFGNATELIIALIALRAGLIEVVKASITGSIISNLLLVMGFSMFLGGIRYKSQNFQPVIARLNASVMNLATVAILVPTAVVATSHGIPELTIQKLSSIVAVILIIVYGLTLLFSMKTHAYLCDVGEAENELESGEAGESPNPWLWSGVLLLCTLAVAYESELLVGVPGTGHRISRLHPPVHWGDSRPHHR